MSSLFNETEADAEVISSLLKEIRRLTPMPLYQLADGSVIHADNVEVVTEDELRAKLASLEEKRAEILALLPEGSVTAPDDAPAEPAAPEAPVDAAAEVVPAPTDQAGQEAAPADAAPAEPAAPATNADGTPIVLS